MRPSGLAEVEAAKADGTWDPAYESRRHATIPPDLAAALAASPQAAQAFDALGKTERYTVILKIVTARTRRRPAPPSSAERCPQSKQPAPREPKLGAVPAFPVPARIRA
jgi:Bacteriocin-protection, YdeI or OmpD-Associated